MSSSSFTATGNGLMQLQRLAESLKAKPHTDVGVLGFAGPRGPGGGALSNVELATIHEFGSTRVPQRSFIRSTADRKGAEWQTLAEKLVLGMVEGRFTLEQALGLLGEKASADVRATITSGVAPENAPSTIRAKGSSKPLIDSGRLLQSVSYETSTGKQGRAAGPTPRSRPGGLEAFGRSQARRKAKGGLAAFERATARRELRELKRKRK